MQFPREVTEILTTLHNADFEAYVVGGCVRDVLLKKSPQDWDIATSASPSEIQQLFPKNFYHNKFGTVTVLTGSPDSILAQVEVTTYRIDSGYTDRRRPDQVTFTENIEQDLARRDFTINALAMDAARLIDPFDGQKDLENKLIKAVGDPSERFSEDALRLLRAIRLASQLNFSIEENTLAAIKKSASHIKAVAWERIRDEVVKMVMSQYPEKGFLFLEKTRLLQEILPEVAEGIGVEQNKHHTYTVIVHNVKSLQFAAEFNYPLHIRLAALLHDVGKPRTRRWHNGDYTFYAHDIVGARLAQKLMERLRFSTELTAKVCHLIRHHMFYYDIGKVTETGARRLLRRVGQEHFADLIKLRIAERKGSGVPKAEPYRLRHLQFLVEKASQQPITTSQLAIDGHTLMKKLQLPPGPQVGGLLNALLAEVIEDPTKNTEEFLLSRAQELKDKNPTELKQLGVKAVEEEEQKRENQIRRKYHV